MGLAIRLLIVATWMALFAAHIVRYALPGMGLVERRDLGAALGGQIDRALSYDILQGGASADAPARRTGGCEIVFQRDEGFFRLDTRVDLTVLPGALALLAGGETDPGLRLEVTQKLDDRLRLTAISGEGALGALRATFAGTVDHRGLTGHYRHHGVEHAFAFAGFGRDGDQGFDWSFSLPAGLRPGERFRAKVVDLDGMTPRQRVGVYAVSGPEPLTTRAGTMDLLRVDLSVDGKARATSWCDERGTVYRMELAGTHLAFALARIRSLPTTVVWPPPAAP